MLLLLNFYWLNFPECCLTRERMVRGGWLVLLGDKFGTFFHIAAFEMTCMSRGISDFFSFLFEVFKILSGLLANLVLEIPEINTDTGRTTDVWVSLCKLPLFYFIDQAMHIELVMIVFTSDRWSHAATHHIEIGFSALKFWIYSFISWLSELFRWPLVWKQLLAELLEALPGRSNLFLDFVDIFKVYTLTG